MRRLLKLFGGVFNYLKDPYLKADLDSSANSSVYSDGAVQFTASDKAYLSIASNATLQTGDIDFEMGAWVYMNSAPGNYMRIMDKLAASGNYEYELGWNNTANRFTFEVSGNGTATTQVNSDTFGAPSLNTWYFVRAYHSATDNKIYISVNNGTADSAAHTTGGYVGNSNFSIGARHSSQTSFWDGRIDSAYFTKTISSTAEATALYNAGAGRMYSDLTAANGLGTFATNLISWWGFNEENGIRYDAKGTNHLAQTFTELITNGSFTSNTTGWTADNGGTLLSVAGGQAGNCLQVTNTTTYGLAYQNITAVAGHSYVFNGYHKNGTKNGTINVGSTTEGSDYYSLNNSNDADWALKTKYFTTTGTGLSTSLWISGGAITDTTLFDEISIKATSIYSAAGIAAGLSIDGNLCASFNGTSQYLAKTDNASLQITGSTTFWGWFNATNMSARQAVLGKSDYGSNREYSITVETNGSLNCLINSVNATTTSSLISVNTWYFFVGGYDAVQGKAFISFNNGTQYLSSAVSPIQYTNTFYVGATTTIDKFNGRLDGIGMIKRLLTAGEQTALFNNGKGVKYTSLPSTITSDANFISFWNLDEYSAGTGAVTRVDSTANANNLTDTGTTPSGQGVDYYEGSVSKWYDQSGNANTFVQTTQANKMLYVTNAQNGFPILRGDGLTKSLTNASDLIGTGDVTVATVAKPRSLGGGSLGRIIDNSKFLIFAGGTNYFGVGNNGSGAAFSANNSVTLNTAYVLVVTRASDGTVNIYINGSLSGAANQAGGTPTGGAPTYIGNRATADRGLDGDIDEIAIYNRILTLPEITSMTNTLRKKWNI